MRHTRLLLRVQHPLTVNPPLEIRLRALTQLIILQGHLPYKLKVLLKLLAVLGIVIIELHPRHARVGGGTDTETAHPATINIERAVRKKIQEQAVVGFALVGDVLAEAAEVVDGVEGGRVDDAEGAVGVLAVQALLVAIHHGLPVEAARVAEAAFVREGGEVDPGEQRFDVGEEVVERNRIFGERGEEEPRGCQVVGDFAVV